MIKVNSNVTTIELTGSEEKVQFAVPYPYYWVLNASGTEMYASMSEGVTANADGVVPVPIGGAACTMHGTTIDTVYVLGTGSCVVMGTYSAFCPFKTASGGGDSEQVKILTGKASTSSEGNITITYDEPFSSPPLVVATSNRTAGNAGYVVSITLGGTTGFIAYIKQITSEAVTASSADFTWVAIGT